MSNLNTVDYMDMLSMGHRPLICTARNIKIMVAMYEQSNYCTQYENVKYGPQAITMHSKDYIEHGSYV